MRRLLLFCLSVLCLNTSYGFEVSGNFWVTGKATIHVGIPGTANTGTSWNTAFKRAMDNWSGATSFQFLAIDSYKDPCSGQFGSGLGDDFSGVDFRADVCGDAFNSSTLAITLTSGPCITSACNNFNITEADVIFNSSENWDIYSGPRIANVQDFERIALHELGHAMGLRHEAFKQAIMQANVSDTHTLQTDDINGANAIYGGGDVEPPLSTIASVYGIDIFVPSDTTLPGPVNATSLNGTLASGDANFNGRFLDMYQYTFSNDSSVDIQLNGSNIDPYLYLVRITSTQDAIPEFTFEDDNSGAGNNARITKTVQAGTYWIGVSSSGLGQSGSYELAISSSNSSPVSTASTFKSIYGVDVQVNPNPTISGALSGSDFALEGKHLDLYQFTVVNQTTLRMELSSADFDTVLILTRLFPNGFLTAQEIDESFLFQNDDSGGSLNSKLELVLTPGNYWFGVTSAANGETGAYQLSTTVVIP